jgi:hypothetical protein
MCEGKASSLPWSGVLEMCFTRISSAFLANLIIGLKGQPRDKHSSLLLTLINYSCKMLYNIGARCPIDATIQVEIIAQLFSFTAIKKSNFKMG